VCSSIWIEAAAADRDSLVTAAKSASHFGLQVDVDHVSRWPWARMGPVRPTVTEDGGCACGMLSDDADWNAEAWAMRTDIIEPLAKTLEVLVRLGSQRIAVAALWAGDRPQQEFNITPADLARIIRTTGLGTKRRYVVERDSGITSRSI
jgi:hypothetical protein